jgi:predicted glycogen debranching enzyme
MIEFGTDICRDLKAARSREWLETNGLGGFASSTIIGLNTRRYHGLLVAATNPPVGRMVLLSKLEETIVIGNERFELSANQYPGVIHPAGYNFLAGFRLDPFPIFTYVIGDVKLEKSFFMVAGENTVVVCYRLLPGSGGRSTLELRPLIAFRDYHSTTHENPVLDPTVMIEPDIAMVRPYAGLPPLWLAHNGHVEHSGDWYRNFEYQVERERGLDFAEDLFNPMLISVELTAGNDAVVIASTERRDASQAGEYEKAERRRRAVLAENCANEFVQQLSVAADQYIVARGEQKTIIAGYHWFADWGRDTMIALPGLTLTTGRAEVARSILLEFARHVDQGMLPNRFPDQGEEPEYNTVDATLWFFEAIRKYVEYTGDFELVRAELLPVLTGIMEWHFQGTRHGTRVDDDGLLACGVPGVQLTWMDAKVGDWVVTPRYGKPVEIQALWHNALKIMEGFARKLGEHRAAVRYSQAAALAARSFNQKFWNEDGGYLYDVINGEERDTSLRPNQIFAISLPHSLLSQERATSVLALVERELLTPYGLRTLAPSDPLYRPAYAGDVRSRDSAYHQGTVWPWLLGPFITAYLKVHGRKRETLLKARIWLENFDAHLRDAGLGQISEVFSAEPPHAPGGCIAQAWSIAELLRAAKEDVFVDRGSAAVARAKVVLRSA